MCVVLTCVACIQRVFKCVRRVHARNPTKALVFVRASLYLKHLCSCVSRFISFLSPSLYQRVHTTMPRRDRDRLGVATVSRIASRIAFQRYRATRASRILRTKRLTAGGSAMSSFE